MGKLILRPIVDDKGKEIFTQEIQEAFQNAYIAEFGEWEKKVIPVEAIRESFDNPNAEAYFAEIDGTRAGGAIIAIDDKTNYNALDLLYVKVGSQNMGAG